MNITDCTKSILFRSFLVGLVLTISAPLTMAQDDDAGYVRFFITTVNADRVVEFESLLKERAAGLRAGGQQPFRSVYVTLAGKQYNYLMVDAIPSLAVLDQPAPTAAIPSPEWAGRIDGATNEQTVLILRTYPDLNIPAAEGAERDLIRFRIRRTAPGRTQDYYEWQANELLPALREAGITGFITGRVVLGGSSQTWVSAADVDSWASMFNNILAESMGERQMTQMLAEGAAMLVHTEDLVMAYRPDLGYVNETLLTQNQ